MTNQQTEQLLQMLKEETASELGIQVGADQTARNNGRVGGNMVRKLISLGEIKLQEMAMEQQTTQVQPYMMNNQEIQQQKQLH